MAFCKKRLIFRIKKYDAYQVCSVRMEDKMKEKLDAIKESALSQIKATDSLEKLNDIRVAFLGKKGELTEVLKSMKEVARFVSEKLSTLEYVNSTATYFVLKKYKEHGLIMSNEKHESERMLITP